MSTTNDTTLKPSDVAFLRQQVQNLMTDVRLTDLLPEELCALIDVFGAALVRRSEPNDVSDPESTIAP
jgi:hypothetical protein